MIIIDENFSLDNKYDMIIPFSFIVKDKKLSEIHCCKDTLQFALKFEEMAESGDPLTLFKIIDENLRPYAESNGFEVFEEDTDDYYFSYKIDKDTVYEKKIEYSKRIENKKYDNLTEYDLKEYLTENLTVYGTVIDGKVVSAAAENVFDIDYDDGIEVSVQTNEAYRNLGYAKDNLTAITKDILSRGKSVYYVASAKNKPSLKLAESCGFKEDSIFFSYCCYKKQS